MIWTEYAQHLSKIVTKSLKIGRNVVRSTERPLVVLLESIEEIHARSMIETRLGLRPRPRVLAVVVIVVLC